MNKALTTLVAAAFAAVSLTTFAQGSSDPAKGAAPKAAPASADAKAAEKSAAKAAKAEKRAKKKAANKKHRDATVDKSKVTQ